MTAIALALALVLGQDAPAPPKANGYFRLRLSATDPVGAHAPGAPPLARLTGLAPWAALAEANLQLRVTAREGYDLFADLSLFMNVERQVKALLPAAPLRNLVVPAELYANLGFADHANGLVGRKRVVWGSGFAINPTDLLDPPKDPTDPTFQRAGAWMARFEAPFERATFTALWAPRVTALDAGLPRRFLYEPGGSQAEQLFAARLYALVADADVNLMWFWSNRFADALPHSHRFGASFSRYFFTDYELHAEALVQRGRDTALVTHDCVTPGRGESALDRLFGCAEPGGGGPAVTEPGLDTTSVYAKVIAGTRYLFSDESLLSLEYYFNGTGLDAARFEDRRRLLELAPDVLSAIARAPAGAKPAPPFDVASLAGGAAPGQPVRFAFEPQRRHYAFLSFQKPKIHDDFTASLTVIAGLEDRSGLVAPGITWSAKEWLSLALLGYVPFGPKDSEYGELPLRVRGVFELQVFY